MFDFLQTIILKIFLYMDSMIYSLISTVYQIILVLAQVNILQDNFEVSALLGRVYVIIGVIILFLVSYSLLKFLVNPDEATKNKKSPVAIIKNVVLSIILIAFIPTIFSFAMSFQTALLEQNTIGNLILGNEGEAYGSSVSLIQSGGIEIATSVLEAFLHENYSKCTYVGDTLSSDTVIDVTNAYDCSNIHVNENNVTTFREFWNIMKGNQNLFAIADLADEIARGSEGDITYYWIISSIAGIYVFFVLLSYGFAIAVRAVKLAVYELIAPLPILARILPNEQGKKIFSNWLKATLATFAEVFVRLAILFFSVFIIKIVLNNLPYIFAPITDYKNETGIFIRLIAQVFIILGIFKFIKEAPEILKEITGVDSKKYGSSLLSGIGMLAAFAGGAATAGIRSAVSDKGNKDMSTGTKVRRALWASTQAGVKGVYRGSKAEKFSDISKAAGGAASSTLDKRARVQAAGGYKNYLKQWAQDTGKQIGAWAGGSEAAIRSEKEASDKILQVIKNVKATAEDYIDKHAYEYFNDSAVQKNYNKINRELQSLEQEYARTQSDDTLAELERKKAEKEEFERLNLDKRLDIIKAKAEDTNRTAEERAYYLNLYNKSRKAMVDNFGTDVHTHTGAEKEAAQVVEEIRTMNELMREYSSSSAVNYFQSGNAAHGLSEHKETINLENAGKYFKAAKDAAEYANIDVQARLNELDRMNERHKARTNKNGDKK